MLQDWKVREAKIQALYLDFRDQNFAKCLKSAASAALRALIVNVGSPRVIPPEISLSISLLASSMRTTALNVWPDIYAEDLVLHG
jgi:hypothetical protein